MILVFDWFTLLTPNLSLAPTKPFLVFCCWHWSSAIKYSSDFRKNILLLHTIIDSTWKILNYPGLMILTVYWFALQISDLLLVPIDLVPGLLLSSLVFCYQIFLWYSKLFLHLHSIIDSPDWSSITPILWCRFLLILISDPRYIAPTDPVPGLLLSSLVLCYQIFFLFSKVSLVLALHNW